MELLIWLWTILKFISRSVESILIHILCPRLIYAKCPDCEGTSFIYVGEGYLDCPDCKGSIHCKTCKGKGVVPEKRLYVECPYCSHGSVPRPWALEHSILPYEDGTWADERITSLHLAFRPERNGHD